ncbi:MAG: class I SAM-dependent DNA methyltransferase [Eubacteriales bacterium]|jgi:SAM-dependent methyltransferase
MSYEGYFARYYDQLNADCDYEAIADYYQQLFSRWGLSPQLVLELGCGSGNVTLPMAQRGYDMIGLDLSPEMLQLAREKAAAASREDILLLCQDMTDFELYGTVEAVICALDGINYLTDKRDLLRCFRLTSLYLEQGGLFVFDVNTPYKFEKVLADNVFLYDLEDVYCIWQNHYEKRSGLCRFDLTLFGREGEAYRRYEESQVERSYETQELKTLLQKAGFRLEAVYHEGTLGRPRPTSERLYYVARKINRTGECK